MEAKVLTGGGKQKIKDAIEGMLKVYTIPAAMQKILQVVEDERASILDLVNVVQLDPALTARILATANTASYGFRRNVSSLAGAAMALGFNMIKSLAVSVSVFKCSNRGDCEYQRDLWHHSFEVAIVASLLAEKTGTVKKEEAFLAGLIHDLGRAILYQLHGDKYVRVFNNGLAGLLEREEGIFGASHSQVGSWFVDKYKFPKECVLALEFHHDPSDPCLNGDKYARNLASVVYVADCAVSEAEKAGRADLAISPDHREILSRLRLDENSIKEVMEEFAGLADKVKDFYSGNG
jgi:putative nucleotidyltransferase with HDIG domain